MTNDYIFSWAENSEGRIVHVDDVPRGLLCACRCPYCLESLIARHGNVREHGFAHHSDKRGANLDICYMVILYKLAEQIVQTKKKILAPSYYGIFPEKNIEFVEVTIDSHYKRADKQPDVIATSKDGNKYLIEFTFNYKVQHKDVLDYKNLTCLEIDLSNQTLESLEDFLLKSNKDRKWLNNENYFNNIELRYSIANKRVRLVEKTECMQCELYQQCCAVRKPDCSSELLVIDNSGKKYRLCKPEQYAIAVEDYRQRIQAEEYRKIRKETERQETLVRRQLEEIAQREHSRLYQLEQEQRRRLLEEQEAIREPSERSCFDCKVNLVWANRGDGYANCGAWESLGVRKKTPPECAHTCRRFRRI